MTAAAKISAGLIPFVQCRCSGAPEWTPAHYRLGKLTNLISCVVCLHSYDDSDVRWLTEQEASERHGWNLVGSEPPPPTQ
jgi:hypothetical protein